MNYVDNRQKGISLVETVVMIGIFALVMAAVSGFVLSSFKSYSYTFNQAAAINEARKGIEVMVKEIREARTGDDGSYPIAEANDSQFIFYSDIDKDESVERIRYFLDGTDFKKGVVESSGDPPQYILGDEKINILSRFARNADAPIFTYYNGDWPDDIASNPLPTATRLMETKLMHIYLKINVEPGRPPDDFELESDVQIRNLKINL